LLFRNRFKKRIVKNSLSEQTIFNDFNIKIGKKKRNKSSTGFAWPKDTNEA